MNVGVLVQGALQAVNPLQTVDWYSYDDCVVNDDGVQINNYTITTLQVRIQSLNKEMLFKNNVEMSKNQKKFYVLTDQLSEVNRSLSSAGDYFKVGDLWYRVMSVDDDYQTGWNSATCSLTNESPL